MVGLGVPPTFVGRRNEMSALVDALEAAARGRGSTVLLCGEPGIGKSRTAEELVAKADHDRAETVGGVCEEGGRAVSYWPWTQVLGSLVDRRSTVALIDEMGDGANDIAVVLPGLLARLPSVTAALTVEPLQARFRLFQSVSSFLRRAAASRPLVVVVEDLHWADASSALLFTAVAQEIRDSAILLVGTLRTPSMGDSTSLTDLVAGVARAPESHVLRLEGLNESDVIEFVRQRTAVTVSDAVGAELRVRTGGNPFFLNEVVKLVADDGTTGGSRLDALEHGVPPSVRETVRRRVAALPAELRPLLEVAAVIGRDFDLVGVVEAGALPLDVVVDLLGSAVSAGLLVPIAEKVGWWSFVHALVKETIYDDVAVGRRMRLHHEIGQRLDALDLGDRVDEVVYHFARAVPLADSGRLMTLAVAAGQRSLDRLAYEQAADHFQLALALHGASPTGPSRHQLLSALGNAYARSGNSGAAVRAFSAAADDARRTGRGDLFADACLGAAGYVVSAHLVDTALAKMLEEALTLVPKGDSPRRARLLARLAMELYWSRDRDRAEAMSRRALELAAGADRPTLRYALNALHFVLWGPDHLDERLQLAHDLLERAEQDNDVEMTLQGHRWLVTDLVEAGDLVAADEQLERCAELAEMARQPLYAWYVCVYRAERALLEGRYDEADRLIDRAVVLGERSQSRSADVFLRVQRFALARDHLDDGDLEAATEALKPRLGMHTTYVALRALGLAELGQLQEARALFDHIMSQVTELPRDALYLSVVAVLAETGRLLQDHSHARLLYEILTPFAGRTIVQATPVCYGAVDYYLGLLAATLGEAPSAHQHLLAAADLHRVWGAEPMLARTLIADAAALLAARNPTQHEGASASAMIAGSTAERLGMPRVKDKADEILNAAKQFSYRPNGLTSREIQVLQLLAQGLANKEIGTKLAISVHTVERHVSSAYAKIGARRRGDAVAWTLIHLDTSLPTR